MAVPVFRIASQPMGERNVFEVEAVVPLLHRVQHANRGLNDLGPDPVAAQDAQSVGCHMSLRDSRIVPHPWGAWDERGDA